MNKPDLTNIPASLTSASFIGDILVAYGFCTAENVKTALDIQTGEREVQAAGGAKARFTGEILVAEGFVTQEQVDFGMEVQTHLRATPVAS